MTSYGDLPIGHRRTAAGSLVDIESLPKPPAWVLDALCAQVDTDGFFPEKGGSTRAAKGVCAACTVTEKCLAWALEHQVRHGIWGGKSDRERRQLEKADRT